ncbi:MAG: hypothetical protein ACRDN0_08630, partial [Trebonia sp.]
MAAGGAVFAEAPESDGPAELAGTAELAPFAGVVLTVDEVPSPGLWLWSVPLPAAVVGVGVGVAVGEVLVGLALGLGLAVSVGEPLAEVEGVAVCEGWPALVVAGATGDEVASCGSREAVAVARPDVVHGVGDPVAAGVTAAAGVANGRADDIAEDP